jgi:HD-GYP domain-containing protein (c-di-GMP phosphodiesterase class II)
VVFFLASIVPLALLALLVDRYVLPRVGVEVADAGIVIAILLAALLSSLSYWVLAGAGREAVAEIRGQNERLRGLLQVASQLNRCRFPDVIAREALESGARLLGADAGFVFPRGVDASPMQSSAQCGEAAARLLESRGAELSMLAAEACGKAAPAVNDRGFAAPLVAQDQVFGALLFVREQVPFGAADLDVITGLSQQAGVALFNARLMESEKNFFTHATDIVVEALDRFAVQQQGHSRRVAHYCSQVGRGLGLERPRLERLFFAALLHDVGMLRLKVQQPAARASFLPHPELGAELVKPITAWSDLAPFILHHHERYDGTGYPLGLVGEDIPLEARIIAVAEAFDAMTHPTSYHAAKPRAEALREIEDQAAFQFDPEVARVFVELARRDELES